MTCNERRLHGGDSASRSARASVAFLLRLLLKVSRSLIQALYNLVLAMLTISAVTSAKLMRNHPHHADGIGPSAWFNVSIYVCLARLLQKGSNLDFGDSRPVHISKMKTEQQYIHRMLLCVFVCFERHINSNSHGFIPTCKSINQLQLQHSGCSQAKHIAVSLSRELGTRSCQGNCANWQLPWV